MNDFSSMDLMAMNQRTVCIVGGGIGGLVCAQTIQHLSKMTGLNMNLILLEKNALLGGQIKTKEVEIDGRSVIIEEGAEGFVTRSEVFPRVATMAGLPSSCIVDQIRIADRELVYDSDRRKWRVQELPPGVAAQKLGFQVPDRDRGRGIRSFSLGMSQIVSQIGLNLSDIRLNSEAISLRSSEAEIIVGYRCNNGLLSELRADGVILGIPMSNLTRLLQFEGQLQAPDPPKHNSHVSVHLLIPKNPSVPEPTSFTIPPDLQDHFQGLRAVALINEKFPNRCPADSWLLRFYYRPSSSHDLSDGSEWVRNAKRTLREVYGFSDTTWSSFSTWSSALPIITKEYLDSCRIWKDEVNMLTGGRVMVIGSEIAGAGLEAAAISGFEAGSKMFNGLRL